MQGISLSFLDRPPSSVLCLGAHSDDIEIGCGGTILRLLEDYPETSFTWIVFSASAQRGEEARVSGNLFLESAKDKSIILKDFKDGFFPYIGGEIKTFFEELKSTVSPDLILTHRREDLHQDHRLIHDLTWNTFRDHLILEYEIPKYDGDMASPNFYVPLDLDIVERKVEILLSAFTSQRQKHWFSADTFQSILRLRGMESNAPNGFAEGFFARKILYGPSSS